VVNREVRPVRTRGYEPERTYEALLGSALELFREKGYHATSVQGIADAAGLTKGAFYHHFATKEDVLRVLHDEYVDHQLAAVREVLATHQHPAEQLRHLIRAILASVETHQANVTVFFQERRFLSGEQFRAIKAKRDELDSIFQSAVDRGVGAGVFRDDLNARVVALGILGMCAWTYQWYQQGGSMTAADVADLYADMVLDGLLVQDAS